MLANCDKIWGNASILKTRPPLEIHWNSLFIPFKAGVPYDSDPTWGLYDQDRNLIDAAAYYRVWRGARTLTGQSLVASNDELINSCLKDRREGAYLYAGTFVGHFGHFLIDMLSRLWILTDPVFKDLVASTKILIHAHGTVDDLYKRDYVEPIFHALGIQRENVIVGRDSVMLESVIIPRTSFELNNFAHPIYIELCREIGKRILDRSPSLGARKDIYFSRSRLRAGNYRLEDEHILEDVMRERGIDVHYPEQMSFRDQIAVVDNADVVYGLTGSAIHNVLFSRGPKKIRGINLDANLNSNFRMIDEMMGNDARYFQVTGVARGEKPPTFAANFIFPNIRETAEQLIKSAHVLASQTA